MNNEKQTCKACGGEGKFVTSTMTSFGTGEREETRCNACCGSGVIYAERATTASAAPTIDRESLRAFARGIYDDRHNVTDDAMDALVAHVEAIASARAEEARREGIQIGAERTAASYSEYIKTSASAQRTAGGDAEKPPHTAEEVIAFVGSHYEVMESQTTDPADVRFQLTVHDLQSAFRWWFGEDDELVAEAAAQADDGQSLHAQIAAGVAAVAPVDSVLATWPEEIYLTTGEDDELEKFESYNEVTWCDHPTNSVDVRYVRADIGERAKTFMAAYRAAPTAQPTPNEKGQPEGQPVSATRFRTDVKADSLAQPTPPDDERAVFEASVREMPGHPFAGKFLNLMWAAWKSRAALRQPGALPDEAVTELLAALDAQEALRKEIREAGMPPHSDYWHQSIDEARERVEKARAALAAKQSST